MNRSYDQGLGLLDKYSMMFFVCTGFFNDSSDNFHALFTGKYKRIPLSEAAGSLKRCHPDSNWRIKVLQTFALPLGYGTEKNGAVDGTRTRDIHLGKVALYQLSYYRINVPWGGIEPPTL